MIGALAVLLVLVLVSGTLFYFIRRRKNHTSKTAREVQFDTQIYINESQGKAISEPNLQLEGVPPQTLKQQERPGEVNNTIQKSAAFDSMQQYLSDDGKENALLGDTQPETKAVATTGPQTNEFDTISPGKTSRENISVEDIPAHLNGINMVHKPTEEPTTSNVVINHDIPESTDPEVPHEANKIVPEAPQMNHGNGKSSLRLTDGLSKNNGIAKEVTNEKQSLTIKGDTPNSISTVQEPPNLLDKGQAHVSTETLVTSPCEIVSTLEDKLNELVAPKKDEKGRDEKNTVAPKPPIKSKKREHRTKKPHKYPGLTRGAPGSNDNGPSPKENKSSTRPSVEEPILRNRSLPIEIRLRFDRGGSCKFSLLAKRVTGMPEEIMIRTPAGIVDLQTIHDEWYGDIVPDDLSRILLNGIAWNFDYQSAKYDWSLSGRQLYVLAEHSDISGFVSRPCLELGRNHVVLCTETLGKEVERAVRLTGAIPSDVFDSSSGAPPGWIALRGITPISAVKPMDGADILNALRPLPQIDISLEGGICIGYSNWLEGYAPLIHLYGDPEHLDEVYIDSKLADQNMPGYFGIDGWDAVGNHNIWCAGIKKSYSIVPFNGSWQLWDAHVFPATGMQKQDIAICGPSVRTPSENDGCFTSIILPNTNPVLLGNKPGQLAIAENVSHMRGSPLFASCVFQPIWALPRDPLHCNKTTTQILYMPSNFESDTINDPNDSVINNSYYTHTWCRLILDANRKKMTIRPGSDGIKELWEQYKRLARQIWRGRK